MSIRMLINGLMMDPVTNMPIVVLRDESGTQTLPIWIGMFEAHAVALQLENSTPARPMTHDLMRDLLSSLEVSVDRIVVTALRERTFYAEIQMTQDGESIVVSSRPSDAIALAVRATVPIFADEEVLACLDENITDRDIDTIFTAGLAGEDAAATAQRILSPAVTTCTAR